MEEDLRSECAVFYETRLTLVFLGPVAVEQNRLRVQYFIANQNDDSR